MTSESNWAEHGSLFPHNSVLEPQMAEQFPNKRKKSSLDQGSWQSSGVFSLLLGYRSTLCGSRSEVC